MASVIDTRQLFEPMFAAFASITQSRIAVCRVNRGKRKIFQMKIMRKEGGKSESESSQHQVIRRQLIFAYN